MGDVSINDSQVAGNAVDLCLDAVADRLCSSCGQAFQFGLVAVQLSFQFFQLGLQFLELHKIAAGSCLGLLIFFDFIVPIAYGLRDVPLPAFWKYICPAGTLEGGLGLLSNAVNESYFSMPFLLEYNLHSPVLLE